MTKHIFDKGVPYEVSTIETSHLLSILVRYLNQIEALQILYQDHPHPHINRRIKLMKESTHVMTQQLISRPLVDDEYLFIEPLEVRHE